MMIKEIRENLNYIRGLVDAVAMMDEKARGAMECCIETLDTIEVLLKENDDGRTHP